VPPVTVRLIEPVELPKQSTSTFVSLNVSAAAGCVTVAVVVAVHPLASVAVKVYDCAVRLLNVPDGDCVPTFGLIE
jgi:hypothetical protein